MMNTRNILYGTALALALVLFGCGNKAPAQSGGGDSKKAVSAALDAVKKGGAEAFATAIQGKTSAELAGLFDSDLVTPAGDFRYDLNEAGDGVIITAYTGTSKIVIYPAEIEGYPVVKIDDAFPNAKAVRPVAFVIPEGVRDYSLNLTYNERIAALVFPSTLRKLSVRAENITAVTLNHTALEEITSLDLHKITSLDLSNTPLKTIGSLTYAWGWNDSIQTVKLPDTVTVIKDSAFKGCRKLTDINLPASLKELGYDAFRDCTELYNLTIPDSLASVTMVGAFHGCGKLPLATRKRLQDLGYEDGF